ncbi:MAG TPA: hypothetical protein GX521_08795 [Firmicutes bacterium]|nr:hypothetical protein [Bacillota bacterium]
MIRFISFPADDVQFALEDTITEGLGDILYSTYNGDLPLLLSVMENRDALCQRCGFGGSW